MSTIMEPLAIVVHSVLIYELQEQAHNYWHSVSSSATFWKSAQTCHIIRYLSIHFLNYVSSWGSCWELRLPTCFRARGRLSVHRRVIISYIIVHKYDWSAINVTFEREIIIWKLDWGLFGTLCSETHTDINSDKDKGKKLVRPLTSTDCVCIVYVKLFYLI